MKSRGSIAVMCALSLALVACGGNAPAANNAEGGAEAQTTQDAGSTEATEDANATNGTDAEATKTEEQDEKKEESAVGAWKVAAAESNGITMSGSIGEFTSMLGGDEASEALDMTFELKEGGTGTIAMGSESADLTWSQTGDAVTISATKSDDADDTDADDTDDVDDDTDDTNTAEDFSAKGTIKDGVLRFKMGDEDLFVIMTKDGTYPDAPAYDKSAAQPITSEDKLAGTWKLVGMQMAGVTMTGDADVLAEQFSYDVAAVTFSAGGKANMFGDDATYTVGSDGTKLGEGSTAVADVLMLDDNLIIDMSGAMGIDLLLVLSK